jgi:ribA/ribD-fused uncharacterized protein
MVENCIKKFLTTPNITTGRPCAQYFPLIMQVLQNIYNRTETMMEVVSSTTSSGKGSVNMKTFCKNPTTNEAEKLTKKEREDIIKLREWILQTLDRIATSIRAVEEQLDDELYEKEQKAVKDIGEKQKPGVKALFLMLKHITTNFRKNKKVLQNFIAKVYIDSNEKETLIFKWDLEMSRFLMIEDDGVNIQKEMLFTPADIKDYIMDRFYSSDEIITKITLKLTPANYKDKNNVFYLHNNGVVWHYDKCRECEVILGCKEDDCFSKAQLARINELLANEVLDNKKSKTGAKSTIYKDCYNLYVQNKCWLAKKEPKMTIKSETKKSASKETQSIMKLLPSEPLSPPPHPRCNYVSRDNLLMVGVMPILSELEMLVKSKVDMIVDLSNEGGTYEADLRRLGSKAVIVRLPIGSGRAPSLTKARETSKLIREALDRGKRVYVHCHGGNGRANTVVALVLGEKHNLNALEAINLVQAWRRTRPDRSRTDLVPIPETTSQVNFLVRALGVPAGMEDRIPDRSDMSWMAKVKKLRKQQPVQQSKPSETDPILFYTDYGEYHCFSNYYKQKTPIRLSDGSSYATTEHAFQAAKFDYPGASKESKRYAKEIASVKTPNMARILGLQKTGGGYAWRTKLNEVIIKYRDLGVVVRPDWSEARLEVMKNVLRAKFTQDEYCNTMLLRTGNRKIAEHTSRDSYWGDGGGDGTTGQNHLGRLLMEVREEIN